ncbi:sensor histidine kinase [Roseateles sp. DXS20W]|uniref:histidine kinase n=1 Tax=Pelomonas lactea TaxID=3299030 RepID=A0ABW7GP93_9BURK
MHADTHSPPPGASPHMPADADGDAATSCPPRADMLSYIAHEIGNPVNAIRGFAQLMQASPLPAGQAQRLAHILEAVERLQHLLADVGDIARMESGQFSIQTRRIELGSFLCHARAAAQAQAALAGLQLSWHQPTGAMSVCADERRLRQCLDNLLSNALKYGHGGGRIDIETERRGDHVVLAVQDRGDGFSDSQMAQLFEPYNRLGRDGGAIPGTGLGLSLTRELMRAMGGRLQVHSDGAGRGARFELVLRAADA